MKNGLLQKKKYIKKVVLAFLSLFIVVQPYITNVYALSNVITYNNYGSFEWSNVNFQLGSSNYGGVALTGNLNQYYSGTLRLNFSGYNSVSFGVILTEGSYISDYGTNYIVLTLQGVNYFQLTLAGTQANVNALTFNSFSNWNLTAVGAYSEIQEVHRIKLDVSSILTAINAINTNTEHINDIYLNTNNILAKSRLIGQTLDSISTKLDDIDNIIDRITWQDTTSLAFNSYSTNGIDSNVTIGSNSVGFSANNPMYLILDTANVSDARLYKLKLGISYGNLQNQFDKFDIEFYQAYNGNLYRLKEMQYYSITTRQQLELYFYDYLPQSNRKLIIKFIPKGNGNTAYVYSNEFVVKRIYTTDIEYWQLINYFSNYNYYQSQLNDNKTIIDKLTELINKQTDIVIKDEDKTEVNKNINNYNNVMTDINGIEINFKNEFNTSNKSIKTQNLKPSQYLQDSRIVLSGVFNTFLDEFAFVKTWLILLLICAIALILLGH